MFLRTSTIGILLTASAFAQLSSFPKPSYFRETFKQTSTKVELQPPVRLKDFVKDGKLELSLKDYLALVMANNTNIQSSYLSLEIARNNITSSYGIWDPTASFGFTPSFSTRDAQPNAPYNNPSQTRSWPLTFGFNEQLSTGQTISAGGNGSKIAADGSYNSFNTGLNVSVTQPLIRNRTAYVNRIPLYQAQSRYKISEFQLRSTLLGLVGSAETAYWTVVSAREALGVQIKARDAQKANWEFVQQQLQLGAISVLDTYTPQTSLAQAEAQVAQATFNLAQVEDQLRTQIAADLDPDIRKLPLNLIEPVDIAPSDAIAPDKEQAVTRALSLQPSLKSVTQNLDVDDLSLASAQNLLLPQLNLRLGYSTAGLGTYYTGGFGSSYFGSPIPGGLGDALGQAFGLGNPTYAASLTLTLPIRSRSASMALANTLIQKRVDTFTVRSTQQSIRLQVLNAVTGLSEALEVLKLDKTADDFAIKQLDADQQKYKLGTEVLQFVVNSEVTLAQADLNLVNAKIAVRNAITSLYLQTGELLDQRGIVIR